MERVIECEINCIHPDVAHQTEPVTINAVHVDELVESGKLVRSRQKIYPTECGTTLDKEGYEVVDIPRDKIHLLCALDSYIQSCGFDDMALKITDCIQSRMENWMERHFKNCRVVCVDAVYRDTDPDHNSTFKQIPLAHIDFNKNNFDETMECFKDKWKRHFDRRGYEYSSKDLRTMVNVWMPIGDFKTFPLAVHDMTDELESGCYRGVRRDETSFMARSMVHLDNDEGWRYCPEMPLGRAYIFESMRTVHTAIDTGRCDGRYRRSCECRCFIYDSKS